MGPRFRGDDGRSPDERSEIRGASTAIICLSAAAAVAAAPAMIARSTLWWSRSARKRSITRSRLVDRVEMHLHDETVFARDAMAFDDVRRLLRELGHPLQLSGHRPDADDRRDRQAERLRIEVEPVAADHAGLLQSLDALAHRRSRHADLARQLGHRLARIGLQQAQQFEVLGVEQSNSLVEGSIGLFPSIRR